MGRSLCGPPTTFGVEAGKRASSATPATRGARAVRDRHELRVLSAPRTLGHGFSEPQGGRHRSEGHRTAVTVIPSHAIRPTSAATWRGRQPQLPQCADLTSRRFRSQYWTPKAGGAKGDGLAEGSMAHRSPRTCLRKTRPHSSSQRRARGGHSRACRQMATPWAPNYGHTAIRWGQARARQDRFFRRGDLRQPTDIISSKTPDWKMRSPP